MTRVNGRRVELAGSRKLGTFQRFNAQNLRAIHSRSMMDTAHHLERDYRNLKVNRYRVFKDAGIQCVTGNLG